MKANKNIIFENILEFLPFGVIYLEDDKIVYQNSSAENILGISREKLLGKSFFEQSLPSNVIDTFKKIVNTGKTARLYEENFVNYFGNKYVLNFYFVPIISKTMNYLIIMEDCSFLKEIEKKSYEYSNMEKMSILFASMAHEIKNPLGVIKGIVQLVSKEDGKLDKEAMEIVISEISRIENVIQELLDYSNPQKVNVQLINIHKILDRAILNLTSLIKEKSIVIVKEYDTTLPDFLADPESLHRAFLNVIKNAIEACMSNGKVHISTKISMDLRYKSLDKEVNYVIVEVADNGVGMSEDDLNNIFTPFFTKKKGGTGLGMVYVQKVVLDHNGFIKINSVPNVGTKISIYLPMKGAV